MKATKVFEIELYHNILRFFHFVRFLLCVLVTDNWYTLCEFAYVLIFKTEFTKLGLHFSTLDLQSCELNIFLLHTTINIMLKNSTFTKGFTLIELLVVITIIGLVMSAGILTYTQIQKRSRDSKRISDLVSISRAMEQNYQEYGQYVINNYLNGFYSNTVGWTNPSMVNLFSRYFPSGFLPTDPVNDATYFYTLATISANYPGSANTTSRYVVTARLEDPRGNCNGHTSYTLGSANSFMANYVTPGTGTHFCVSTRQ